jgi:hypothetical protein
MKYRGKGIEIIGEETDFGKRTGKIRPSFFIKKASVEKEETSI